MNDSIKYNRDLRGKRKSLKEIYEQEIKNTSGEYNHEDVKERVTRHLARQRKFSIISRITAISLMAIIGLGVYFTVQAFKKAPEKQKSSTPSYFKTVFYDMPNNEQLKVDYYKYGPKAAETRYKNGLKHQNSESYYSTGEQFRSALYFKGSLIIDLYLFKDGDTIKNFPNVSFHEVHHIELTKQDSTEISFDFLDGKIIYGTYHEKLKR